MATDVVSEPATLEFGDTVNRRRRLSNAEQLSLREGDALLDYVFRLDPVLQEDSDDVVLVTCFPWLEPLLDGLAGESAALSQKSVTARRGPVRAKGTYRIKRPKPTLSPSPGSIRLKGQLCKT